MKTILWFLALTLQITAHADPPVKEPLSMEALRRLKPGTPEYDEALHAVQSAKAPPISLEKAISLSRSYNPKAIHEGEFMSSVRFIRRKADLPEDDTYSGQFPIWEITYSMNYNPDVVFSRFYVAMDGSVSSMGIRY